MNPEDFAVMIAESVKKALNPEPTPAPEPVQKAVSLDDVKNLLVASFAEFTKQVDARIEKATTFSREGVGRIGQVAPEDLRDADPLKWVVKKARDEEFDDDVRALMSKITTDALSAGMKYGEE